jgi:alpha-L-rhamnosidase
MMKKPQLLQNFSAFGLGCLLLGTLSGSALADSDDGQGPESRKPLLRPISVASTSGNVQNAEALVADHQGYATLTMVQGGTAPMVILDYGRDVGGLPVFEITAVLGTPRLEAIYSEAQQWLFPTGDGSYPDGAEVNVSYVGNCGAASLSRVNTYSPSGPGLIVSRLIQGGERFQALTLTTPGSVTLRQVGVRPTFISPPTASLGYFRSSDPALNEIWNLGASTLELNRVPARSLPPSWTSTSQGVDVKGSTFSVYQAGTAWSNYTASFDAQVVTNETGWMVYGDPIGGFRFVLAADNDTVGPPNTLRLTHPFVPGTLAQVPLPFDLKPGTWHRVRIIAGTTLQTYVDDELVMSLPIPGAGSFGFAGYDDTEGLFRNLLVSDASGNTLLQSTLTDSSILDAFTANTNSESALIDGAKRDRFVWSGDLAVSAPTLYYTSGASDAVAGSLRLHGSYQRSSGQVPGNLPPQLRPGLASGDAMPSTYYYSLSYSIYFVTTLYEYYLYTGDKDLVRWAWPVVQKDLAYVHNTTNAQHLVVTDASNDSDWHPHDQSKLTGTVTEFNALYYHSLREAAQLAEAIGHEDVGVGYEAEAALVKNAINATLFDATTGLYDISDQLRGPVAQDANAMAVLFGVAHRDQRAAILQRLAAALDTANGPLAFSPGSTILSQIISPFISSFDAWARFENGDAVGALALIRTVWGHMRQGSPYYSGGVWEALAPDGSPATRESAGGTFASLAHGWASGPTSALSKYVLGVRPVQPGYRTWLIEPQTGDLTWAEGTVPTPYGPIAVRWQKTPQGLRLEINVPNGTSGSVGLPTSSSADSVADNGQLMQKGEKMTASSASGDTAGARPGYAYLANLGPGMHVIQVTGGDK